MAYPLEEECFTALAGLGAQQTPTARDRTAKRPRAHRQHRLSREKARAVASLAPILLHPDLAAQAFEVARSTGPYWKSDRRPDSPAAGQLARSGRRCLHNLGTGQAQPPPRRPGTGKVQHRALGPPGSRAGTPVPPACERAISAHACPGPGCSAPAGSPAQAHQLRQRLAATSGLARRLRYSQAHGAYRRLRMVD